MIETATLFRPLHRELVALLRGVPPGDWARPTVAGNWTVRDVTAHLLDSQVRRLSFQRDGHPPPAAEKAIEGYEDLVTHLDRLNAQWVVAWKRASPAVLVDLLEHVGSQMADFVERVDPDEPAFFPVDWAGSVGRFAWFDIGRDFTELWHHQAQIRDALGEPLGPIARPAFARPLLELALWSVARDFGESSTSSETALRVSALDVDSGEWTVHCTGDEWVVSGGREGDAHSSMEMDLDTAWRLFFNALDADSARNRIRFAGDSAVLELVLRTRSVMVSRTED